MHLPQLGRVVGQDRQGRIRPLDLALGALEIEARGDLSLDVA
jgi:regulator of sirC expression with transglutaminase-like and TPR domain